MGPGKKKGKQKQITQDVKPQEKPILQQDAIPAPIASLNVGDIENFAMSYEKCVKGVVKFIRKESRNGFTFKRDGVDHYIPLTPGLDTSPNGAYSIEITDGERALYLVAQKYQVWFRGIITDKGKRYEIDGMTPRMMAGSQSLDTTSMYYDMLGATVDECRIGFHPLIQAFYDLVNHQPKKQKDPEQETGHKAAIAVILVMLFEAARFPELYDKCLELIKGTKDDLVGEKFKLLINNWSTKSLNFYQENGEAKTVDLTEQTSETIKEVAKSFSILCRSKWDQWLLENGKKDYPAAYDSGEEEPNAPKHNPEASSSK